MKSWLKRAREAAGLEADDCALLLQVPLDTYAKLEQFPGRLTLDELRTLRAAFDGEALTILQAAVIDLAQIDVADPRWAGSTGSGDVSSREEGA